MQRTASPSRWLALVVVFALLGALLLVVAVVAAAPVDEQAAGRSGHSAVGEEQPPRPAVDSLAQPQQPAPAQWGKLPLAFIPNAGQTDATVRFQAHSRGGSLFFTRDQLTLALPTPDPLAVAPDPLG